MTEGQKQKKILFLLMIGLWALAVSSSAEPEFLGTNTKNPQASDYSLLDRLMRAPRQVRVHQFSSHNKKGLNGDENWPLYIDEHGDEVIFDSTGPACIRSMWGTNFDPEALFKFYFDGEKEPRITVKILDFYQGKHPLFPTPLVSYEKRGMWGDRPYAGNSFVPIPFEKELKIAVSGKSRFFHIIYEKYPYKTGLTTFTGKEDRTALIQSFENLGLPSLLTKGMQEVKTESNIVEPGQTVSLLKLEGISGIIRKIEIEADGSPEFFQNTWFRMRWDGHTHRDVFAPTGIFFGSAVEADEMLSLPLQVEIIGNGRVRLACYFPMPFFESAEVDWINLSSHRLAPIKTWLYIDENPLSAQDALYFTTLYRDGQTSPGRDWRLFEGLGAGWYVGTVQSMRNAHYCEGDEHFTMDGAISPQINGTGSEDYYLACFWPNVDFDTPFGGVVGDITKKGGGEMVGAYYVPSCYSRYHLEAPLPFYSSMEALIQHGGLSQILSDYRSLSFCYLRRRPALVQTDFLDVGNETAEKAHGYRATSSGSVNYLTAHPEGENFTTSFTETGRSHSGGEITFRVAVNPDNEGVRLRRLLDQAVMGQRADVFIDGQYSGTWYHGYQNSQLRWYDSDFDIHPIFTHGKNHLNVKLHLSSTEQYNGFTDFRYSVFCYFK